MGSPSGINFLPSCVIFFFNDTATTEIYTLSLHDALPISWVAREGKREFRCGRARATAIWPKSHPGAAECSEETIRAPIFSGKKHHFRSLRPAHGQRTMTVWRTCVKPPRRVCGM